MSELPTCYLEPGVTADELMARPAVDDVGPQVVGLVTYGSRRAEGRCRQDHALTLPATEPGWAV